MTKNPSSENLIHSTLHRIHALHRWPIRHAQQCFYLEGIRQFVQAYDAGLRFDCVTYSPVLLKSPLVEMLIRRLASKGVCRVRLTPEQFRSVSSTSRASGIGAICKQSWTPLHAVDPMAGTCWLVVESLLSLGNLGTILRTAVACQAGGVIFIGPQCDPFDPTVVRASMGGIFHLQLVRTSLEPFRHWIQVHQVQTVGLSPEARRLWTDLSGKRPTALAIGDERNGLSKELRGICAETVRLPMANHVDSLNVGVAAGVVMYELVRRTIKP